MYNKQVWKDEIPDLARPILDGSGKQKTDPQTGRPLFELVQEGTRITSARLNTMEGGIEGAHTLVEQLAKELGGDFVAVIDGVMGLQCSAQGLTATWTTGIAYVGGRRYEVSAGTMPLNPTQGQYLYLDIDGIVKKTTSQATAKKGLLLFYVATDTSGVISSKDHRVNISMEETMKKLDSAVTTAAQDATAKAEAARVSAKTYTDDQVKGIANRLDTVQRQDVVLNAGMQILNAQRRAAFSLGGIKGRTLVNLAGRTSYVAVNEPSIVTLNVSYNANYRNTQTINVDIKNTNEGYIVYRQSSSSSFSATAGKYYVILADIKINSISGSGEIKLGGTAYGAYTVDKTKTAVWQKVCHRFTATSDSPFNLIAGTCYAGGVFATANFDIKNISFYEVSQSDYDNLRNLSEKELAEKYPYVDSVTPVRNPYAIRYGENLLPPFYEASFKTKESDIIGPYKYVQTAESTDAWTRLLVTVLPQTDYTLSFSTLNGKGKLAVFSADEQTILLNYGQGERTFNSGNVTQLAVYISGLAGDVDTIINPMLNLGRTAKPFKPREDAMLALQTDLYADPLTGANADEVFEKDGQYFKLANWKKVVLDGSLGWGFTSYYPGFRGVRYLHNSTNLLERRALGVKFDGKIIPDYQSVQAPDKQTVDGLHTYVWISNADSGWGDMNRQQMFDSVVAGRTSYQLTPAYGVVISVTNVLINGVPNSNWGLSGSTVTLEVAPTAGSHVTVNYVSGYIPTIEEIKAYFMGWKMGNNNDPTFPAWNGTGTKVWYKLYNGVGPKHPYAVGAPIIDGTVTATVPTMMNDMGYTPYQLVYQLKSPVVEPVVSEGMLTLNEGDNQIEVGTGIVLRESTKPYGGAITGGLVVVNYKYADVDTWLKYPLKSFVGVYRNGMLDPVWDIKPAGNAGRGLNFAQIPPDKFDPSAAYSVTYLMLDTSPIVPFNGSYAANEKAMLQELTDSVQQNAVAVSALMQRKLEKDNPVVWITPTLLNGWDTITGFPAARFYKDQEGVVHLGGFIRSGVVSGTIFVLPKKFRPTETIVVPVVSAVTSEGGDIAIGTLNIHAGGEVQAAVNVKNGFLTLESITFLAGQ